MPFDVQDRIIKIRTKQGLKEYLEVKHRIAWFRAAWPHGNIKTHCERLDLEKRVAVFSAEIVDGEGGSACGHGSYSYEEKHPDFVEMAETRAVGRALEMLGFGTTAASQLDENVDTEEAVITSKGYDMDAELGAIEESRAAENSHAPVVVPLPAEGGLKALKLRWQKAYKVGDKQPGERWIKFKVFVLGKNTADAALLPEEMAMLNGTITAQERTIKI